ncbi:Transglutaminase-like superfamily protein [Bernardetia litoralis DSM 6794]|uniref:Transglutaminase-like superfamily protein n=1 Tax=Bernardetia litoralis (strain ATCC 23117 / DSM 6794 / NBRC 15988 / NCIMB 1366 / Fx l1 / Sio-4) TaxID=880071 RepID=I4ANV0_BERLS|nr:transglutaminase-like domain-containing protein [Bernardetia litoralis]AFM05635.1 Transglutaminase-like superfamily protein [Bernardetia litoralis DSM 6794]
MKNKKFIGILVLSFLFIAFNSYDCLAQEIAITPKPNWVKNNILPYAKLDSLKHHNKSYRQDDIYQEVQVNVDTEEEFRKVVLRANDVGRTNQQSIRLRYSPKDMERKIIDVALIKDSSEESIITRINWSEGESREFVANQLWDSEKGIELTIDKISEGDMYSFSILTKILRDDVAVDDGVFYPISDSTYIYLRVTSKKPLNYQTYNGFPNVKVTKHKTHFEYIAEGVAITPYKGAVPNSFIKEPFICLSKHDNFESVARIFSDQFKVDKVSSQELDKLYERLNQNVENDSIKIRNIVNYVQDSIIYQDYGLIRSYQPAWCIKGGRGDCKAKSLIAIELFKRAGIKALPVLVKSPEYIPQLDSIPSLHSFNHVIVQLDFNNKKILLDPTAEQQTDKIGAYSVSPFKKGLVIDTDSISWVDISFDKNSKVKVHDIFSDTITRKVILTGEFAHEWRNFRGTDSNPLFSSDFFRIHQENYTIELLTPWREEDAVLTELEEQDYNSFSQDSLVITRKLYLTGSLDRDFMIASDRNSKSYYFFREDGKKDSLYTGLWDLPYTNQSTKATYDKDKIYIIQQQLDTFNTNYQVEYNFGYYKCRIEEKGDKYVIEQDVFVLGALPIDRLKEYEEFQEKVKVHQEKVMELIFAKFIEKRKIERENRLEEQEKDSKRKKKRKKRKQK